VAPSVTLALVGDVMLGRVVNRMIAERGFAYPWGDLLPALRGSDCFLINLECALTDHTERWQDGGHKPFYFRANPRVVETLLVAGVDFASLANNHAADFGMTGLLDTVSCLDEAGITHAGAGGDVLAARAPAFLTAAEWRIGVVAFADHPTVWAAGPSSPGINYTPVSLASGHFGVRKQPRGTGTRGGVWPIYRVRSRGSSTSRRLLPIRLKPSTVTNIAKPGMLTRCGAVRR
jgi:poly-gamma-glutamate capsule biosynthesis protein CapA/YwtB (metallophosphatase superfamily)